MSAGEQVMTKGADAAQPVPALTLLDYLRLGWYGLSMSPGESLGKLQDRHGSRAVRVPVSVPGLFRHVVLSADPCFAEAVALNKDEAVSSEQGWGMVLSRGGMFTKSLLQLEFDEHRHDRLVIQQVMSPARLSAYMSQVAPKVQAAVRTLPTGDQVDMRKLFKRINMSVAIEIFLGMTLPAAEVDKVGKALDDLVYFNLVRQMQARRYLWRFLHSWLPSKRAVETPDLMSQLCHAKTLDGRPFSDRRIIRHLLFFLFAAHDTTTITTTNMAYYLALNPKWQRRARAQSLELPERIGMADLAKMTELDNIMKETLRFRTPVPVMVRAAIRETTLNGYRIASGTLISSAMWGHHTNPAIWSEPRRFDPDRFSEERAEHKDHRVKWMPFGGGVHKCIGMHFAKIQIFTLYHTLLREFEWSVDKDYVLPTLRNSLLFSTGFKASVRRREPDQEHLPSEVDSDQLVGWGIMPNSKAALYGRSLSRRLRPAPSPVEPQ
ncbi:cytochrome P450 [Mycolicibacter minnesotensis]